MNALICRVNLAAQFLMVGAAIAGAPLLAQTAGHNWVHGTVKDPLGALVVNATIDLLDENQKAIASSPHWR